ncbi:LON-domain-containing protein [Coprinopsis sp. MPI-PUGE-AT-0042]|nr:LON-domain-containing protein [Coprinopsis sp. MPI-PUGE-AT-0042]
MLDLLQEILLCSLCRHPLHNPVALHCGHSLCQRHLTDDATCPVNQCAVVPPSAAAPVIPSSSAVDFRPAVVEEQQPPPPLDPNAHDVVLSKILALVQRTKHHLALRQRPADDEGDDDEDRPRKRRKFKALVEDDEPDLLTHLTSSAGFSKTSHPSEEPPRDPTLVQFEKELLQELSCDICSNLFYQPVTTPCQHTFCSKCLQRSLDHSPSCPVCRMDLPGYAYFQNHPSNKVILRILLEAYRPVYEARAEAIKEEERAARLDTPIFVCVLAFPGMPTGLHIFEPRYRLMLRRCLESDRPEFGMLPAPKNGDPSSMPEFGTMLEIKSVQMLPDGRSFVNCWGTSRFRILERGLLDGYTVARIERIDDLPDDLIESIDLAQGPGEDLVPSSSTSTPSAGPSSRRSPKRRSPPAVEQTGEGSSATTVPRHRVRLPAALTQPSIPSRRPRYPSNAELIATCKLFLDHLQRGTAPWVVQRLSTSVGEMPEDPAMVSFYVATILPIDESEKQKLLWIRSPRLRLLTVVHWIEKLNNNWWFSAGCTIL